jgi:hypothetical protein
MVARTALSPVLAAAVLAVALAGCAADEPAPVPVLSSSPSPTAPASAAPDGSASGQRALFDLTNTATAELAGGANPGGRAFVDGLVAAGFDKTAMQVTPDKTAINLDADNVQFSVLIEGECLIGQFGNVGYQSVILPVLSTGACLVGNTRPIDW